VNGWDPPATFELVERDLTTDAETTTTYQAGTLKRVDATSLGRAFAMDCPTGEVVAAGVLGWDQLVLQLGLCPRAAAPGFGLQSVWPVLWFDRIEGLGDEISAVTEVSVDGHPGWRFQVGADTVTVSEFEGQETLRVDVDDGGGPHTTQMLTWPARLDGIEAPRDETLTFTAADPAVRVDLQRRFAGQGVGESSLFAPLVLRVELADRVLYIDGLDELDYTNTHHNWNDALTATRGDVVATWSVRYNIDEPDLPWLIYEVSVTQGGETLLPLTRVDPVTGP
jgi:hypothetical protein